MTPSPLDRRGFLVRLGVLSGAGVVMPLASCSRRPLEALDRLIAPAVESDEAEALGVEYLGRYPTEADDVELRTLLLGSLPNPRVVADVIDALHHRMLADFEDGETVRLGGWLFSRTELRLYALVAIGRQQAQTPYRTGVFPVERDGVERFRWTGAAASVRLAAGERAVRLRLRATAPLDQSVKVSVDGSVVEQVALSRGGWQTLRYQLPEQSRRLDLAVSPTWQPRNDFRTLGVQWNERAAPRRS